MQPFANVPEQTRRYRPRWWLRIFALFFFSFSLAGLIHFWGDWFSGDRPPNSTEIIVPALLVLVGLTLVIHYFATFVILFPNAIELQTAFSRKRLSFSEIRGRREYETTDSDGVTTHYIRLEPHDQLKPTLKFQRIFNFDGAFYEWLNRLPNLKS
jgi:hypothetical protein